MKLRKFLKRVGSEVNPSDLKQEGFDFQKIVKIGFIALGTLTLILLITFAVLPSIWGFWEKSPSKSNLENYKPISFTITNESNANWSGVTMVLEGASAIYVKDVHMSKLISNEKGSFAYFDVGNISRGQSRSITVYIYEPEGRLEYTATFYDANNQTVKLPETKVLEF